MKVSTILMLLQAVLHLLVSIAGNKYPVLTSLALLLENVSRITNFNFLSRALRRCKIKLLNVYTLNIVIKFE